MGVRGKDLDRKRYRPSRAIVLLLTALVPSAAGICAQKLESIGQTRSRSTKDSPDSSPIAVSGQVTFVDGLRSVFMQDATSGILVKNPRVDVELKRGQRIQVTGPLMHGGYTPVMTGSQVKIVKTEAEPVRPVAMDSRNCLSLDLAYRFVELEGVVLSAVGSQETHSRAEVTLFACNRPIKVFIRNIKAAEYKSLVDATVGVRGVFRVRVDALGKPVILELLSESLNDVAIRRPAPDPRYLPLTTAAELTRAAASPFGDNHQRVRLHGTVQFGRRGLVFRDGSGTAAMRLDSVGEIVPGPEPQDITAYVSRESGKQVLEYCHRWTGGAASSALSAGLANSKRVLTTVKQIRQLSDVEIDSNLRVRLHGVVTYADPIARDTFLQDATGGIFVYAPTGGKLDVKTGQELDLEGMVSFGGFAPVVIEPTVRVTGERRLPAPLAIPMEELLSGAADSQLVTAIGTVRAAESEEGHLRLEVVWGVHRYVVYVAGTTAIPPWLLDADVKLTGVCGAISNFKRQIVGIEVSVPSVEYITQTGARSRNALPLEPVNQLLGYSNQVKQEGRARVGGQIIFTQPTGPTYIRDASGGLLVKTHKPAALSVGDWVEVIGTPRAGTFAPYLENGALSKIASLESPAAQTATYESVLEKGQDADFVQMEGYLVDDARGLAGETLLLQEDDHFFEGHLLSGRLPHLPKGSLVQVSGLTALRVDESSQVPEPTGFIILLRSPSDIALLRNPPWWTPQKLRSAGLGAFFFGLIATAWMLVLSRQVRSRTQELQTANEKLALLADRDGLTGAINRRKFDELVLAECKRARRSGSTLALVMVDIDYFKGLNDHYGHQRGDNCLVDVVEALRSVVRSPSLLARYGGEEFALILPETEMEVAVDVAERMRKAVAELRLINASSPLNQTLSVSLGVAAMKASVDDAGAALIRMADEALYASKKRGRNRVTRYDFLNEPALLAS